MSASKLKKQGFEKLVVQCDQKIARGSAMDEGSAGCNGPCGKWFCKDCWAAVLKGALEVQQGDQRDLKLFCARCSRSVIKPGSAPVEQNTDGISVAGASEGGEASEADEGIPVAYAARLMDKQERQVWSSIPDAHREVEGGVVMEGPRLEKGHRWTHSYAVMTAGSSTRVPVAAVRWYSEWGPPPCFGGLVLKIWFATEKQGDPGMIGVGGQLVLKKTLHLVGEDFQKKMWNYFRRRTVQLETQRKTRKEPAPR